jgi:RhoGEF domain
VCVCVCVCMSCAEAHLERIADQSLDIPRYNDILSAHAEFVKLNSFRKFLRSTRRKSHSRGLEDFLIQPIQQVPRYSLLFAQLLDTLDDTYNDYELVKCALAAVKRAALSIEEAMKRTENGRKVFEIQSRLVGKQFALLKPSRKFVTQLRYGSTCPLWWLVLPRSALVEVQSCWRLLLAFVCVFSSLLRRHVHPSPVLR